MLCYHVVVHESVLIKVLTLVHIFIISKLWKNKHFHLIVYVNFSKIWDFNKLLHNNDKIRSEKIDFSIIRYVNDHFFNCSEKEHDSFCNFTLTISSLKHMCIESILKNLDYLHNMEKLKLPKPLLKDIFQQNKSIFNPKEYNDLIFTASQTEKIFENLTQQDVIFPKDIVFWLQKKDNNVFQYYTRESLLVFFDFMSKSSVSVRMCLKCMKFENENGNYQRRYKLMRWVNICCFVQDPNNWCKACRQVPLFQILTYVQYRNLYKFDIYDPIYMSKLDPLIKTDYFENGEKVKNRLVSNETMFGGTHHPYIK